MQVGLRCLLPSLLPNPAGQDEVCKLFWNRNFKTLFADSYPGNKFSVQDCAAQMLPKLVAPNQRCPNGGTQMDLPIYVCYNCYKL